MSVTASEQKTAPAGPSGIRGKYLSLTTYRRDGSPVSTPVWFVEEGGQLYVTTGAESYKARRLRRNPAAMVAACSARGTPKGDAIPAVVEFLPEPEHERVDRLMAEKYRLDRILILPLYRLVTKLRRTAADASRGGAYLKITPT